MSDEEKKMILRDNAMRIWSGDILMDLDYNQAMKMTVTKIDGAELLFIEKDVYRGRGMGWNPLYYVLKRETPGN